PRPCHRVPDQRREPGNLRAEPRAAEDLPPAGRARHAGGHARLRGLRDRAAHTKHQTPPAPPPGPRNTFPLPGGPGTRVDTHGYEDYVIPPHYDSLVAKLIVHDRSREQAITRMSRALDFFVVEGIHTSIPLHKRILRDPDFAAGRLSTRFIERFLQRTRPGG